MLPDGEGHVHLGQRGCVSGTRVDGIDINGVIVLEEVLRAGPPMMAARAKGLPSAPRLMRAGPPFPGGSRSSKAALFYFLLRSSSTEYLVPETSAEAIRPFSVIW